MSFAPVFGSTIGQIVQPFLKAMAWLLAFFYAIVPNYAIAIALLTVVVMIVTAPLTIKSMKSMFVMQKLQPELKKIQQKYKGDRVQLNEEMMKLYRENNVNPAGGCLPILVQAPVFMMLYGVIRGLTNTVTHHGRVVAEPRYIGHATKLYTSLVTHPGEMRAFGINLADTVFSHHASWVGYLPYALLIVAAIGLQYFQMRQMNARNPAAAQANPQMQAMQRYMPLIFAIIYLRISAGVNVYFVISNACRIGIQEWTFRSGTLEKPAKARRGVLAGGGAGAGGRPRRSLMDRLAEAQKQALAQQEETRRARELGLGASAGLVEGSPPATRSSPRPAGGRSGTKPGGTKPGGSPGPGNEGGSSAETPASTNGRRTSTNGSRSTPRQASERGDRPDASPSAKGASASRSKAKRARKPR